MPKKIPPASPPVDIESKMGKLRVVGEDKSNKRRKVAQYSFDQKLPFMLKDYFKNSKDYVEVEYMAFPFSEDHFSNVDYQMTAGNAISLLPRPRCLGRKSA